MFVQTWIDLLGNQQPGFILFYWYLSWNIKSVFLLGIWKKTATEKSLQYVFWHTLGRWKIMCWFEILKLDSLRLLGLEGDMPMFILLSRPNLKINN